MFDIVIGNPPYCRDRKIDRGRYKFLFSVYRVSGSSNYYVYFYFKGLELGEVVCYLSPINWLVGFYGRSLRDYIKRCFIYLRVIDCVIFENFGVRVNIFLLNRHNRGSCYQSFRDGVITDIGNVYFYDENILLLKDKDIDIINILSRFDKDLSGLGYRFASGYKANRNVIDRQELDLVLSSCGNDKERSDILSILRAVIGSEDIKRYKFEYSGKYLIMLYPEELRDVRYRALFNYLVNKYKNIKTEDIGLNRIIGDVFSEKEQVWIKDISSNTVACLGSNEYMLYNNVIVTGGNLKFLLGLLNSEVFDYLFCLFYGTQRISKSVRHKVYMFPQFVTPSLDKDIFTEVERIVDRILVTGVIEHTRLNELILEWFGLMRYKDYILNKIKG